jgi:energy-coupling factor transporter ATP-binding protein EcfA2
VYVAKVKLENIRGFHDARRVDLDLSRPGHDSFAGWTVLVGRSGSGKTTLLRAVALALAGPEAARGLAGDAAGWVSVGKQRGGVELDLSGALYVGLTLSPDGLEVESNISRADFLCVGYGPYRRLGGAVAAHGTAVARLGGLFREDLSLAESLAWLVNLRQGDAKDVVLRVLGDGLLPQGFDPARLRELGEGERTVAAIAIDLMRHMHQAYGTLPLHPERPAVVAPGVVLVDEIEAHLHPLWQQRVGEWFKEHFPAVQFLVSTNSPLVCQSADPCGLIHLPPQDEARSPYVVEDDLYRRVVFGSAEDVLLSDLFGVDSQYSPRARRMRQELVDLELKVLDGQASEVQVARYRELQELLVSSPAARAQEIEARLVREKARRGLR